MVRFQFIILPLPFPCFGFQDLRKVVQVWQNSWVTFWDLLVLQQPALLAPCWVLPPWRCCVDAAVAQVSWNGVVGDCMSQRSQRCIAFLQHLYDIMIHPYSRFYVYIYIYRYTVHIYIYRNVLDLPTPTWHALRWPCGNEHLPFWAMVQCLGCLNGLGSSHHTRAAPSCTRFAGCDAYDPLRRGRGGTPTLEER